MADDSDLLGHVEALLAIDEYRDHPLYPVLEQLYRHHQGQQKRLERLLSIADGYQQFSRDEMLETQQQYARQLQRERKLSRISDRYQELMRDNNRELHTASTHDPLTGLANRRMLADRLKLAGQRSRREGLAFSVAMLDVDHFKHINDRHGHEVGDRILVEMASLMGQTLRAGDLCGRWGGEEFLLLLNDCTLDQAQALVERLFSRLRQLRVTAGDTQVTVTVSAGIAQFRPTENEQDTVNRADRALLAAKRGGRDRYRLAE
ncbi:MULTISPECIES: biofilm regulation diguanylate cyclase SiaD [Modicisalibacter]|uniref:biofilm regulation diguanylate cyclase SiaD n=1 Tax=Modicisalibacter TaxID=574347 RepID=UPI001CCB05ED|nr:MULTISPECIES: biofilm regulation diguanylate cyclase SiaD [Halomonadaceae]